MQYGDLDNGMIQRIIFLWERTLGYLPTPNERHEARMYRHGRYEAAVKDWDINEFAVHRIADLWLRYDLRVDVVVTTRNTDFSTALSARLDTEDVLVRNVFSAEIPVLARKLPHLPDVARVVFGDPSLQFAFGHWGRYMAHDGSSDFILS